MSEEQQGEGHEQETSEETSEDTEHQMNSGNSRRQKSTTGLRSLDDV
jgi:hypothetical protein